MKTIIRVGFLMSVALCAISGPRPAFCQSKSVKPASKPAATKPTAKLEIAKWPLMPGAMLVKQVHLAGGQLAALSGNKELTAEQRGALQRLIGIQVITFRLPDAVKPQAAIAFYEGRVRAAGYKMMVKDFEEAGEGSAVYRSPEGWVLVMDVSNEDPEDGNALEIVSVQGSLKDFEKLKGLEKLKAPKMPTDSQKPDTAEPIAQPK
jgi:hypothetical protein